MKSEADKIKQVYAVRENNKEVLKNHQRTYPHYISEEWEKVSASSFFNNFVFLRTHTIAVIHK